MKNSSTNLFVSLIFLLFIAFISVMLVIWVEGSNPKPGNVYSYTEKNPFNREKHIIKILQVKTDDAGKMWVEYSYVHGDSVSNEKFYARWSSLKDTYTVKESHE